MNISTTIIGLVLLSFFVIPVILLLRSGKEKRSKFIKDFTLEATRHELLISEKSIWEDTAIGIDITKNKILYFSDNGNERSAVLFHLADIKKLVSTPDIYKKTLKNNDYKNVEKLLLTISFKDPIKEDININFFSAGFNQNKDEAILIFNKWADILKYNPS